MRQANRRDEDGLAELFMPDAEVVVPLGGLLICYYGHRELRKFFRWLTAEMPRQTLAVNRVVEHDGWVVVVFEATGETTRGRTNERIGTMLLTVEDVAIQYLRMDLDGASIVTGDP
jgi:hypothetical protein